jgi:hypothetical protein
VLSGGRPLNPGQPQAKPALARAQAPGTSHLIPQFLKR